jgi:hypothetical protein
VTVPRPRKHPLGSGSAHRKRASRAALIAAGGAVKSFGLSPRAVESMALIRATAGDRNETALMERLIEEERERRSE